MEPIYTATTEEREYATDWHGGQSSMLYAVSSTGALALGTVAPSWTMNDDEWRQDLLFRLQRELTGTEPEEGEREMLAAWQAKLAAVAEEIDARITGADDE